MSEILSERKKELIEKIGVFHEQRGMQPLMGRILGLLMVLDEAEATFEEIVDYLNVSKSAVSNALNFMQIQNKVKYKTKPGERKRYFYLKADDWENDMQTQIEDITQATHFLQEVIDVREQANPSFTNHLQEVCSFLEYVKTKIPSLFEGFRKQKG
ncbi:GbsR/MarR family transcriptional regulator [Lunatimonas salinarum]|uniref:GbsR/MarR family transcriptional regulator n=1 Tax=Lunatimonas salinarum TaxID=1774590 RepID=UPI001FD7E6AE|nr:ArsR family transcriptional regulator [Lunatimonas salinarum]